jgi:peptide/nickel transport system permease protein
VRTYILKRLLLVPPTMLGITLISFLIMQLAPGDPANMKVSPGVGGQQKADKSVSREIYEKTLEQFDLDKPKLMQYVRWLGRLCGIDVQVWGAKKAYKAEVKELLVARYREESTRPIEEQRARLEARIAREWEEQGRAAEEVPAEVERQLEDWIGAQAEKRRFKHSDEISATRQRYLQEYEKKFERGWWGEVRGFLHAQWYGKGFEGHFEFSGVALNWSESGWWYPLDFGTSFKDDREVLEVLDEKIWVSMELSLISIFVAYLVAIPLGIHSSVSHGTVTDQVITTILFILYSLPSFWVAIMLLLLVSKGGIMGEELRVFPVSGIPPLFGERAPGESGLERLWDHVQHLVLPVACLTYASFAYISRQMRAGMMDVIRSDYIRTARAKGLSERVVIFKHALRNSLIPILTIIAVILPALVGGSVIIETIFNVDGIGKLSFDAILNRNYPVLMAVFTLSAFLTLMGILLSDLLYAVVDPQISFEGK